MEELLEGYDERFMDVAFSESTFASCDRRHVGCVVTRDGKVLGTGFNTSPRGTDTCRSSGHIMVDGSCKRTIHAEINACLVAISLFRSIEGAIVYVTDQPCSDCLKFMTNLGVSKVFYVREYPLKYHVDTDIEVIQVGYDL